MAESERITVFGTSAKYLAMCEKHGLSPAETHDLSALKTILSTGSPLANHSFDYVYSKVKKMSSSPASAAERTSYRASPAVIHRSGLPG
jgi:acyl-coenzyme A synthetase/AMP-(fatty) acid ligase